MSEKDKKRMWIIAAILLVVVIGVGSDLIMKDDNAVEEGAETIVEDMVEIELQLPGNPLKGKIDLSPNSPEVDNS